MYKIIMKNVKTTIVSIVLIKKKKKNSKKVEITFLH
jgi:hypothetical protein